MSNTRDGRRFAADNRAVSAVVGFILIFGILMLTLTVYQAQIVPQQNAQTEFEHFGDVVDDMVDIRSGVSAAGQSERAQFPTITLSAEYQTRILTINPVTPRGTVQTSEAYPLNVTDEDGTTNQTQTRFLAYQAQYYEINIGVLRYENSVLYLDERAEPSEEYSVIEDQNLATGDGQLRITALQTEGDGFDVSGSDRVTLDMYPTETESIDVGELSGTQNVTFPTRLDAEYWEDTIGDEFDIIWTADEYDEDVHEVKVVEIDAENLVINAVEIR